MIHWHRLLCITDPYTYARYLLWHTDVGYVLPTLTLPVGTSKDHWRRLLCLTAYTSHTWMLPCTGLTHAKLVSLTSPCCSGWPAPMNTPQGQQRTAEQRWVRWLQCLIRKWSCVNHQFQFHTQIAYKPTYMTLYLCYLLLFNNWHWNQI